MPSWSVFSISVLFLITSCAAVQKPTLVLPPDAQIEVAAVKNLSGVTLLLNEFYIGDSVGTAGRLEQDTIDLALLTRAALISGLRQREIKAGTEPSDLTIYAAITEFTSTSLRSQGWLRLGITLMLISAEGQELTRGQAAADFQLFTEGPDQLGALGEQRFVADRIRGFVESLANAALQNAKLG